MIKSYFEDQCFNEIKRQLTINDQKMCNIITLKRYDYHEEKIDDLDNFIAMKKETVVYNTSDMLLMSWFADTKPASTFDVETFLNIEVNQKPIIFSTDDYQW